MATVTVYAFEVPDIREGDYVLAKGKATLEYIAANHCRHFESSAEEVDKFNLTDDGRYHEPNEA